MKFKYRIECQSCSYTQETGDSRRLAFVLTARHHVLHNFHIVKVLLVRYNAISLLVTEIDCEMRVRCRDCTYGRRHGQARLSAQYDADRHHRARPTHRVDVLLGEYVMESREPENMSLQFDDDAPF